MRLSRVGCRAQVLGRIVECAYGGGSGILDGDLIESEGEASWQPRLMVPGDMAALCARTLTGYVAPCSSGIE